MRLGFIGCGKIALHHAAAFQHLGARIVAGNARSERSERWTTFCSRTGAAFRSTQQQLEADDIDGLVVCLPPAETAAVLGSVLGTSKPVLIEKPIAPAGQDLTSRNKLVGYNRRYYDTVARLRERFSGGGLVAVQAALPGDIQLAAIHGLDLLFHLCGPLEWVCVGYNGMARTASGVPVLIAMNRDDPVNAGLRFLFDDATSWHLSPFETLSVHRGFDVSGTTVRRYKPHLIEQLNEPEDFKPGFLRQAAAFLSGDYGPGARPSESVRLMEFVDEIH